MRKDLKNRRYTLWGRCCRPWRVAVSLFAWVANQIFVVSVQGVTILGERMLRFDEEPCGKCALLKVDRREHPDESHLVFRECPFILSISFSKALLKAPINDPSPESCSTASTRQDCSDKAELQTGGLTSGKINTENPTSQDDLSHKHGLFSSL